MMDKIVELAELYLSSVNRSAPAKATHPAVGDGGVCITCINKALKLMKFQLLVSK